MAWLARSIANSLKFDDDEEDEEANTTSNATQSKSNNNDMQTQSSSPSSTPNTPRGVKEDLSEITKTLTRQFWGVASFLAPPPLPDQHPPPDPDSSDEAVISGIRSDFAEIGGKFKTGISKLSTNIGVSEITKMASSFLQIKSDEGGLEAGDVVGVTEEVLAFARNIALHPETWLDFPVPDEDDFDDFDMSDAQQEHALAVEHLASRLAALRIELCPGHMSEGCFWKIYFVLLHPRLNKQDAELLSTPQIMEARGLLMQGLRNSAKANSDTDPSGNGTSYLKESADLSREGCLSGPTFAQFESVPRKTSDIEALPSTVAADIETEKHLVQSTELQVIDKSVVKEEPVNQIKHQTSPPDSSNVLREKFEDDADDWLKENSEMVGVSGTSVPFGNDEDVSFSDLEDDDVDVPITHKNTTSGSDSSTKDSRDWVQLGRSSTDSVKDIDIVGGKCAGSEQTSTHSRRTKESNDWLDVDDIDAM
ncbi:BSD domain-containing protein [Cephalotus follicularis]|uniref:BSD domain-containing protein n=1 Tax=Cephalotus follicularis TaxID=3775 RepID=A0A1Q3AQ21_CEPFO|nr:BSD domain-containing protein [Cephalotus follicularis]